VLRYTYEMVLRRHDGVFPRVIIVLLLEEEREGAEQVLRKGKWARQRQRIFFKMNGDGDTHYQGTAAISRPTNG